MRKEKMTDHILETYTQQVQGLKGWIPALDEERLKALDAFAAVGIPQKKNEKWRYTDLAPLRKVAYALAPDHTLNHTLGHEEILPEIQGDFAARLVYVNGRFDKKQSSLTKAMQSCQPSDISAKVTGGKKHAQDLLNNSDGIILLNTALMHGGYILDIPAGIKIEKPILIHHVVKDANKAAVHVRHTIELGKGAQATVVECFSGDESSYWFNNLLEINVAQNAALSHLRLFDDGANAIHTGKVFTNLDAHSTYKSFSLATGGKQVRSENHVKMIGEVSHASLNAIALATSGQNHDILTTVDHSVANASSDQMFRSVLAQKSQTSFQGKVIVQKGAQHTLANQSCNSIILDRTAQANAKPELEIWADDVKCSHGATVGELDEKALFYLVARGIAPGIARNLLIEAFVSEVTEQLEQDILKDIVIKNVQVWLEKYLHKTEDGTE